MHKTCFLCLQSCGRGARPRLLGIERVCVQQVLSPGLGFGRYWPFMPFIRSEMPSVIGHTRPITLHHGTLTTVLRGIDTSSPVPSCSKQWAFPPFSLAWLT